jgi:hypothetical protein
MVYTCFTDPEAIADGLKPFTISHTAKNISHRPNGASIGRKIVDRGSWPKTYEIL